MASRGNKYPGHFQTNLKGEIYHRWGKGRHQESQMYAAFDKTCKECGKKGHFGILCQSKNRKTQGTLEIQNPHTLEHGASNSSHNYLYINELNCVCQSHGSCEWKKSHSSSQLV